jgi:hypothetical protein
MFAYPLAWITYRPIEPEHRDVENGQTSDGMAELGMPFSVRCVPPLTPELERFSSTQGGRDDRAGLCDECLAEMTCWS